MGNDRAYIVTYVGDGVVNLPRVGIFQTGTRAWVDAEMAEMARRHGHFVVTGPDGMSAPVVDEMRPPPAPVALAPVPPAPVAPAPVPPAPVALAPVAPAPVALAPVAPAPVALAPVAPAPETAAAPAPETAAAPAPAPRRKRQSVVMTVVAPPSGDGDADKK